MTFVLAREKGWSKRNLSLSLSLSRDRCEKEKKKTTLGEKGLETFGESPGIRVDPRGRK